MEDKLAETEASFLKPVVADVVNKYLDCGDLTKSFARIYCENCKKSMLLPFSCKGRWFCPSCHEKKVLLFGEFITGTIATFTPWSPTGCSPTTACSTSRPE